MARKTGGALELVRGAAALAVGRGSERCAMAWRAGVASALVGSVLAGAVLPSVAHAGPEGEQVVRGDVRFERDGAGRTIIRAGDRSIINYRSFDIGAQESVQFIQPGSNARVLNRINGAAPTRIDGALSANGRVYIVNPAGVVFGNGAVVDVGGLFAAAGNMSDADFVRGVDRVSGMQGSVVNEGSLRGREIVLAGGSVANLGNIVAPAGTVVMAAGESVVVGGRGEPMYVRVEGATTQDAGAAAVSNTGTIDAPRGRVFMTAGDSFGLAIRTSGSVTAREVTIEGQGTGRVVVDGATISARDQVVSGGVAPTVRIAGARVPEGWRRSTSTRGGDVTVTGEVVGIFSSTFDASGANGGGRVLIGGDVRGEGSLRTADVTVVDRASSVRADATRRGDGGTVVVFASDTTRSAGALSARGGAQGGDGGLVETSGKNHLSVDGSRVDAGAVRGNGGQWLLDPRNVTIAATPTADGAFDGSDPDVFTPSDDDSVVLASDIVSRLDAGTSVTITTGAGGTQAGNITIAESVVRTSGATTVTLRLEAANDIVHNAGVTVGASGAGVNLNVEYIADRSDANDPSPGVGAILVRGTIDSNGGNVLLAGGNVANFSAVDPASASYASALRDAAARGSADGRPGVLLDGATVNSGDGAVTIRGAGFSEGTTETSTSLGQPNAGVVFAGGASVAGRSVSIDGVGGNATSPGVGTNNSGIVIDGGGGVAASDGGIVLRGRGGDLNDAGQAMGVRLGSTSVTGTGTAGVAVVGVSGGGTGSQLHGVDMSGTTISLQQGTLAITGRSRGAGTDGSGVRMSDASITSSSTGAGRAIGISGVGAAGVGGNGLLLVGNSVLLASGNAIELTGEAGGGDGVRIVANGGAGIVIQGEGVTITGSGGQGLTSDVSISGPSGVTLSSGASTLTLRGNSMDLATGTYTGDTRVVETRTAGTTIGLGDGAAGTLALSDAEVALLLTSAGDVRFGAADSGLISVLDLDVSSGTADVIRLRGTDATLSGFTAGTGGPDVVMEFSGTAGASGTVSIDRLAVTGNGRTDLRRFGNSFGTVAANVGGQGALLLTDTDGVTIGSVAGVTGLTLGAGGEIFSTDAGSTISVNEAVTISGGQLLLSADEVDFAADVSGPGGLVLAPFATARDVRINDTTAQAGALNITDAELLHLQGTLSGVTFGSATGTGEVSFAQATNLLTATTLRMGGTGGRVNVNQELTATGGALLIDANEVRLASNIVSAGRDVTVRGASTLVTNVSIDTTNAGAAAAGANVLVDGTLDADDEGNARTLTVLGGTGGRVSLSGNVGSTEALESVTASGASVSLGNVRTLNDQAYTGALTLSGRLRRENGAFTFADGFTVGGNAELSTNDADVTIGGPVTSQSGAGTRGLTVSAGTGVVRLASVNLGDSGDQLYEGSRIILDGDVTGGEVVFEGPVVLERDVQITAFERLRFDSTVDSQTDEFNDLSIGTSEVRLGGDVGGTTGGRLGQFITSNQGVMTIAGTRVQTQNDLLIGNDVVLQNDVHLDSLSGRAEIAGEVDGDGTARALTIDAANGMTFNSVVGGASAVGSITTTSRTGTLLLGNVTTSGAQTYGGDVEVDGDITLAGASLTFQQRLDSQVNDIVVNAGTGSVEFVGAVGSVTGVRSLRVTAGNVRTRDVRTGVDQVYNATTTTIGGAMVSASGGFDFAGNVLLASNATLSIGGGTGVARFRGNVDGQGQPRSLTISTNTGSVLLEGNVGGTTGDPTIASVNLQGATVALRQVRTQGSQVYTGATVVNGPLTSTGAGGTIAFAGATTLEADTTITTASGDVIFGGTLDSDETARTLTVNTGGNSQTRFQGAVGGQNRLAGLVTNADGTTLLATTSLRAIGDVTFNDAVTLGSNATVEGNDVTFGSTLNSDAFATPRSLTVNTAASGTDTGETVFGARVGGVNRLASITTNSDGTTRIVRDIATTRGMTFGDAVLIGENLTLDGGSGAITFRAALDADGAATDPLLVLRSNASGNLDEPGFRFGASVGATRRLGGLTLTGDRAGVPRAATVIFSDAFDNQNRVQASGVSGTDAFTVTTGGGGFTMGASEKILAFGSLTIGSTGTVTLSDVGVLNNLTVNGAQINVQRRPGAQVQVSPTSSVSDPGVDIVAGGAINFSRTPGIVGSGGAAPTFSPGNGQVDSELNGFTFRFPPSPLTSASLADPRTGGATLLGLDLRAQGPSRTVISTDAYAPIAPLLAPVISPVGVLPQASDLTVLGELGLLPRARTSAEVVDALSGRSFDDAPVVTDQGGMGVVSVSRIDPRAASRAAEAYRGLLQTPSRDGEGNVVLRDDGSAVMVSNAQGVRDELAAGWERYSARVSRPSGLGWRAYLESMGTTGIAEDQRVLAILDGVREVLDSINDLGLTPAEVATPIAKVLAEVRPATIQEGALLEAATGVAQAAGEVGTSPARTGAVSMR